MMNNSIFSIGLMSGTSLDGVDLVYTRFNGLNYQDFEIIYSETFSYDATWKATLQTAIFKDEQALETLDLCYGDYLGDLILKFIKKYAIHTVDFIASHGHTVLHQPKKGITLQIGNGAIIAKKTNYKVVYDFRVQDVKLGGQGAPLVPIGDELLFSEYQYCLNLGGFSNLSFREKQQRIAFDICPVNIVLNHYANQLHLPYDASGAIAKSGNLNQGLLSELNALAYYKKKAPKSLGLEWVQSQVLPIIDAHQLQVADILHTLVIHMAMQIGSVVANANSILITGGGAFNDFLIQKIEEYAKIKIALPDAKLINFKEALLFSFLGLLKVKNQVNCLKSVTGASKNHSSGKIVLPSFLN